MNTTAERMVGGLVVLLGVAASTILRLRAETRSMSDPELDATVARNVTRLAATVEDSEAGVLAFVVRAETPPDSTRRWFWHVVTTCPDCTGDPENPAHGVGSAVHERQGWAGSRRAARGAVHLALHELTDDIDWSDDEEFFDDDEPDVEDDQAA